MTQGFYIFAICCTDRESRDLLMGMTLLRQRLKKEMLSPQNSVMPQSSVMYQRNISGNTVMNQDEYEIASECTITVLNSKDTNE